MKKNKFFFILTFFLNLNNGLGACQFIDGEEINILTCNDCVNSPSVCSVNVMCDSSKKRVYCDLNGKRDCPTIKNCLEKSSEKISVLSITPERELQLLASQCSSSAIANLLRNNRLINVKASSDKLSPIFLALDQFKKRVQARKNEIDRLGATGASLAGRTDDCYKTVESIACYSQSSPSTEYNIDNQVVLGIDIAVTVDPYIFDKEQSDYYAQSFVGNYCLNPGTVDNYYTNKSTSSGDTYGSTLARIADKGNMTILRNYLFSYNAGKTLDIDGRKDKTQMTALMVAIKQNKQDIALELIASGASLFSDLEGQAKYSEPIPLDIACKDGFKPLCFAITSSISSLKTAYDCNKCLFTSPFP